ncbi:MAG: tRNA-dihydrouridine synthase family protein [Holophaga sp.]|nr:tRNA-dihydrouridine synthase family protein [Holophaga sp.]
MFEAIRINGRTIAPALFLAPMAGVTNSAFRRLLADFGGYGALFTEMLSASAFLHEDPAESPFTRRRDCEGPVFYQFRISSDEDIGALFRKLPMVDSCAVDLNLGCPAPRIQAQASGCALYRNYDQLASVLQRIRQHYSGTLTVKTRLGDDPEHWREPFLERLRLFEDCGVNAITVHPRFSGEKLKRRARWHEFPWIAAHTRLPVIGNGDICCPEDIQANLPCFEPLAGIMLGRIAAVKPWIFREFAGLPALPVDYLEVWNRIYRYTLEDMAPERAFGRLKEFTFYFAKNFFFGHEMFKSIQKARTPAEVQDAAARFLEAGPRLSDSRGLPFS